MRHIPLFLLYPFSSLTHAAAALRPPSITDDPADGWRSCGDANATAPLLEGVLYRGGGPAELGLRCEPCLYCLSIIISVAFHYDPSVSGFFFKFVTVGIFKYPNS